MDIQKIDKNFAASTATEDGMRHFPIPQAPFSLYGVTYDKEKGRFLRLPEEIAASVSEGVLHLSRHTAGGRLRFSTDSDRIEIKVTYSSLTHFSHMPLTGTSGFTLVEETDEGFRFAASFRPLYTDENGFSGGAGLAKDGKMHDYILYFPLYNDVTSLTLALRDGSRITSGRRYREELPVLYYGSSITQGGCASRPDNSYQALISKWNNIDYINLGFSGSAKAEESMAAYLASIPCSIFVCDYDHNAPNAEHLKQTHEPLYRTFRAAQPNTPILLISRPSPEDPASEGPLRREIIRATYRQAKREGDGNIWFLDGRTLFGKADRENCTMDGCHPNDLGFYRMAKAIYPILEKIQEKTAAKKA